MENQQIAYVPMYKSYIDAVAKLTPEDRLAIYEAIFEYGFTGIEPKFDNPYLEMGWNLVKPNLVNNISRVKSNQENGKKGGRPKKELITETLPTVVEETIQPEVKAAQIEEKTLNKKDNRFDELKKIISDQYPMKSDIEYCLPDLLGNKYTSELSTRLAKDIIIQKINKDNIEEFITNYLK
jgi:hypothetical protein